MRWRPGIRLRLTFWYAAVLTAVLVAFGVAIYVALERMLERNLDDTLEQRASSLLPLVEMRDGQPVLPASVLDRYGTRVEPEDPADEDDEPDQDEEPWVRTRDNSGAVVSSGGASPSLPDLTGSARRALETGDSAWAEVTEDGDPYRVLMEPIEVDGAIAGVLELGESSEEQAETLAALRTILFIAVPAAVAVTGVGGLFLALRALRPIDRITRLARRISAEDLAQRLDLDLPDDELGRLARTFDEMLARLENEFRRQRQFTADASHELRTPLTALKGHVDVALTRERTADEYRGVLQRVNTEVDRMVSLVGSLLLLARADAGELRLSSADVNVGLLVETAVEHVRPLAAQRGIQLEVAPGESVTVSGDESLLLQLLLNLLDNALKHTPEGGTVSVSWQDSSRVRISVTDTGSGIADADVERIFDRFYRVDAARSRADGGTGLGLAIVKWIAEAHGGTVSVASRVGEGSTFTVELPRRV